MSNLRNSDINEMLKGHPSSHFSGIRSANGVLWREHVAKGTFLNADAGLWERLHEQYDVKRINHQKAYCLDGPAPIRPKNISAIE